MERKNVIRCILAILMMIYIGWAMVFCHHKAAARTCKGVKVEVFDPSHNNFVTSEAVFHNLATLGIDPTGMFRSQIDLRNLENTLAGCDNIETVNCVLLTDDSLLVEVQPIVPLLRVFDRNDQDYYINRAGKRMEASCLYRIDVPVVVGLFDEKIKPVSVLPYVDYLAAHPEWESLVSAFEVNSRGDIIMVPAIRGHVVNLGDTCDIDNKFRRLSSFYAQVMPVKGWQYYDTLSVKWRSRVIASRHNPKKQEIIPDDETYDEIDDISTMTSEADSLSASAPKP